MSGPYSLITQDMVWSYSRVNCFEMCPYKFFLTYINGSDKAPMFFSDYGSFLHDILSRFYTGIISKDQLVSYYLLNFQSSVRSKAPSPKIFQSYFQQGLEYLSRIEYPDGEIIAVERGFDFSVNGIPFTGVADLLVRDGHLILWDHKARALKPRSTRGKYTKTDEELDRYLRQLYLYSIAVKNMFGDYPSYLAFNCYRTGQIIIEPFDESALNSAEQWAEETISKIHNEDSFTPCVDYFHCRYLCDVHDDCKFFQLNQL